MAVYSTGFLKDSIKYAEDFNLKWESYDERRANRNKKEKTNSKKKYNTIKFYKK